MDARREHQQDNTHQPNRSQAAGRRSLWLWLVCGILLCQLAGVTAWSRYRLNRDGKGVAVVASLVTEAEFSMVVQDMPTKPGERTTMNFMVTNFEGNRVSETRLQYTVKPETAGNLPLKFTLSPNETEGTVDGDWIASGDVERNQNSAPGFLRQGEKITHHYTLTIDWPLETGDGDDQYADEIDYVKVRIHANQVSPE